MDTAKTSFILGRASRRIDGVNMIRHLQTIICWIKVLQIVFLQKLVKN